MDTLRNRLKPGLTLVDRLAAPWWGRAVTSPTVVTLGVLGLLAGHLALHALGFTGLLRDELETVYWGQGWALGYDVQQPPLHNWMAGLLMKLFPPTSALFGALRVATIGLLLLFLALTARAMAPGRPFVAPLAVVATLTTVMLGLNIFLNLTHSLLLLAVLSFCLWTLTRVARPGAGRVDYLLVGLALGLGALSKYSFALFALGLLAGAIAHPTLRRRLWDPRILWTLGLAILIVLPHGVWMLLADHTIAGEMPELLKARPHPLLERLPGVLLTAWVDPVAGVVIPLILVAVAFPGAFRFRPGAEGDPTGPWRRFLLVYFGVCLALAAGITLALGGSSLRDHYLLPAVLAVPLWLALRVAAGEPEGKALSRLGLALGGTATLMGVGLLVALAVIRPMTCGRCLSDLPVDTWESEARALGFTGGLLFANDLDGGANLLARFPGSRLVVPGLAPAPGSEGKGGDILVVVDPRAPKETVRALKGLLADRGVPWPDDFREVEGLVRGPFTTQARSLSLAVLPRS
jgi:4-amino-4-deoxy-L-arabinose transferase-like glycosyltransferase